MNLYQFMGAHPVLTFFLAVIAVEAFCYPFKILNRWIRHLNIVARGWPPPHLDADGDLKKEET
jgi:hypothetical protein